MDILNPAIGGELGSKTRQRMDGVEYRVELLWLAEAPSIPRYPEADPPPPLVIGEPGVWALTLAQADGTVILAGQLLRHGVNVIAGYRGDSRFPGSGRGRLLAWDFSGNGRDPGRDDLDPMTSVRLVYMSEAEFNTLAG